jgi:hypothetical protein
MSSAPQAKRPLHLDPLTTWRKENVRMWQSRGAGFVKSSRRVTSIERNHVGDEITPQRLRVPVLGVLRSRSILGAM